MWYANRESWGRTQDEVRGDLNQVLGNKNTWWDLLQSGVQLVDNYLNEIQSDRTIADRLDTTNNNKLLRYKEKLVEDIYDYNKNQPWLLAEKLKDKKGSVDYLSKIIDDKENETLRRMRIQWWIAYMNGIREQYRETFWWEPFTLYNDWRIVLDDWLEWHNLKDIQNMFSFSWITQAIYYSGKTLSNSISYEDSLVEHDKTKKYFNCWAPRDSDTFNIVEKIVTWKAWNQIEEVFVVGRKEKARREITTGGGAKPFDGNFTLKYNGIGSFEIIYDWISYYVEDASKIPLCKWMVIQETEVSEAVAQSGFERDKNEKIGVKRESEHTNPETDCHLKQYVWNIPESLKNKIKEKSIELSNGQEALKYDFYNKFVFETENQISKMIKWAKARKYEPWEPTFSKRSIIEKWMMEWHFWDENNNKVCCTFWPNKNRNHIWFDMYDLIDGNESDYKQWLNTSFKAKWSNADFLTQYEFQEAIPVNFEDQLDIEKIRDIKEWLKLLDVYIDNCRVSEWCTVFSDDDIRLKDISLTIKQEIYNLSHLNPNWVSKSIVENRTIKKICRLYSHLWINTESEDDAFTLDRLKEVFYETSNIKKVEAIYRLNNYHWLFPSNPSLVENLIRQEAFASADLNMVDYQNWETSNYFRQISNLFLINDEDYNYDESDLLQKTEKMKNIDKLYDDIKWKNKVAAWKIVKSFLINNGALPKKWWSKYIDKECETIAENLNKVEEWFLTKESLEKEFKKKKNELISNQNWDSSVQDQVSFINNILNDENKDQILQMIVDKTNDQIKYWCVWWIVRKELIETYARNSYAMCIWNPVEHHSRWQSWKDRRVSDMVNDNIRWKYSFFVKSYDVYAIKSFCVDTCVQLVLSRGVGKLIDLWVKGVGRWVRAVGKLFGKEKFEQNIIQWFTRFKWSCLSYVWEKYRWSVERFLNASEKVFSEEFHKEVMKWFTDFDKWTDPRFVLWKITSNALDPVLKKWWAAFENKISFFADCTEFQFLGEYDYFKGFLNKTLVVNNVRDAILPLGTEVPVDDALIMKQNALISYIWLAILNRCNDEPWWQRFEHLIADWKYELCPGDDENDPYIFDSESWKVLDNLSNRKLLV